MRAWNATALVQEWREQLAVRVNQRLAARGLEARVDHRSYATRGLEIEGRSYDAEQRRNGWMAEQLEVIQRNAERIITNPKVALAVLHRASVDLHPARSCPVREPAHQGCGTVRDGAGADRRCLRPGAAGARRER